ncbi:hypothetical protein KC19_VG316600 [Ceratodon purpureus]|uniref:Reverse transcriptase Ty1/copia-type domain-containing protein n=1 Tax=Ceratodon purpureus TaxID=3225 RepID=A0A8T0HVG5_CERPU|nr:hypothetical protein KC19_VG316600 [Ceratodon purpureus]
MLDLGLLSYSLGLEFLFQSEGILMTQRRYIHDMLLEFGMDECKPAATPMLEKLKLVPEMHASPVDVNLYQRMVGKLIFLSHTRIDIAYAVSIVSRFMSCPQEPHQQAVKHLLRYLKGTEDYALLYRREGGEIYMGSPTPIGQPMLMTGSRQQGMSSFLDQLPSSGIAGSSPP